jgi:hypothetical protein
LILRRFFLYLLSLGLIQCADWMNPNSYGPLSLNNYQLSMLLFRPFHVFMSLLFLILAGLILYRMLQFDGACQIQWGKVGVPKRIASISFLGVAGFIIFTLVQNHLIFTLAFVSFLFFSELGKVFYLAKRKKKPVILQHFRP